MTKFVLRRCLHAVPVFLAATFLVFALVFVLPGDPIRALTGFRPQPPAVNRALRDHYNLDDPLVIQYLKYLGGVLRLDFGTDFSGREVSTLMRERLPTTMRLATIAIAVEIVLGTAAGVLAAVRHRRFTDTLVLVTTLVLMSMPLVVLAPLAREQLIYEHHWFPRVGDPSAWPRLVLPGFVLGAVSLAYLARLLRATLVETLRADYIRTATAKGLRPSRVLAVHLQEGIYRGI